MERNNPQRCCGMIWRTTETALSHQTRSIQFHQQAWLLQSAQHDKKHQQQLSESAWRRAGYLRAHTRAARIIYSAWRHKKWRWRISFQTRLLRNPTWKQHSPPTGCVWGQWAAEEASDALAAFWHSTEVKYLLKISCTNEGTTLAVEPPWRCVKVSPGGNTHWLIITHRLEKWATRQTFRRLLNIEPYVHHLSTHSFNCKKE